eukprot:scaffold45542_cov63-Phaeocystis_antarctica.AAC.3
MSRDIPTFAGRIASLHSGCLRSGLGPHSVSELSEWAWSSNTSKDSTIEVGEDSAPSSSTPQHSRVRSIIEGVSPSSDPSRLATDLNHR